MSDVGADAMSAVEWTYRPSEHQLLIGSARSVGLADIDRQEAKDACHECVCGRLAFDSSPPCGHWPQERVAA